MAKPVKTQWDFGDLFGGQRDEIPTAEPAPVIPAREPSEPAQEAAPGRPARKILSVSELTAQIRRLLEGSLGWVWVTGEITNLKVQNSGHIYFTLKDAGA